MEDYKAKAEAVREVEMFHERYAISVCPSDMTGNPTVIAAQAANELLGIRGIRASFVMTEYENQIYISARSIDEVNVQTIMEKLGRRRSYERRRCPASQCHTWRGQKYVEGCAYGSGRKG